MLKKSKAGDKSPPKDEAEKQRESGPKRSGVEQQLFIEKELMKEYGFLKNLERNKSVGPGKIAWPTRIKVLFDMFDQKMRERDNRAQIEKDKKAKLRKVRPHQLISGEVILGILGKIYPKRDQESSADEDHASQISEDQPQFECEEAHIERASDSSPMYMGPNSLVNRNINLEEEIYEEQNRDGSPIETLHERKAKDPSS